MHPNDETIRSTNKIADRTFLRRDECMLLMAIILYAALVITTTYTWLTHSSMSIVVLGIIAALLVTYLPIAFINFGVSVQGFPNINRYHYIVYQLNILWPTTLLTTIIIVTNLHKSTNDSITSRIFISQLLIFHLLFVLVSVIVLSIWKQQRNNVSFNCLVFFTKIMVVTCCFGSIAVMFTYQVNLTPIKLCIPVVANILTCIVTVMY